MTDVNSASSPSTQHQPEDWMRQALELARQSLYVSDPNPRVGCVLVDTQNKCIAQGFTQAAGQAHAEVMALRGAQAQGLATQGATAYVTLEPCSHHGRTAPCVDALISAGIARVVIAAIDPNPQVCGLGMKRLQAAGIQVEHGLLAQMSEELNIGFFSRMRRQLPWVRLKMACSLDGKTALVNGQSQWITGEAARSDGHAWRARASAILTGAGTILADDPQLNVRALQVSQQPWHAIIDTYLETPPSAAIFKSSPRVLVYTTCADPARHLALQQAGATICVTPRNASNAHVDLQWVLRDLAKRECNELHVEAGSVLSSALLENQLVDELLLYMAPRLIGQGRELLQGLALQSLEGTLNYAFHRVDLVGEDLRVMARVV